MRQPINLKNIVNLYDGIITYNEFYIDLAQLPESQQKYLDEDLIIIKFNKRYIVDVGWSEMLDPEASFIISVIEDRDWDEPLYKQHDANFDQFIESLQKAIDFTVKFIKENPNRPMRDTALD